MFKTAILLLSCLALAGAESITFCGTAPYYPSQYTCYNKFLCPIIHGEPTLQCGDACYLPEAYRCVNNMLEQQNTPATLFTLTAINSPLTSLNGLNISACGQALYVGGNGCSYCPEFLDICASFPNITVFYQGLGLAVTVPGGQQSYMTPDGAIGYTQAHSSYQPPNAMYVSATAFSQGYLVPGSGSEGWIACHQPDYKRYQLFAKLTSPVYVDTCYSVNLRVNDVPQGTSGAWQWT